MRDPASDGSEPRIPAGLTLDARSPRGRRHGAQPADRVYEVLSIRDSGAASPRSLQRDLQPVLHDPGDGTGLGLAIVHRIMDAHAGAISVERARARNAAGRRTVAARAGALVELLFPRPPQSTVELKAGGASPLPIHLGPGACVRGRDPQSHAQPLSLRPLGMSGAFRSHGGDECTPSWLLMTRNFSRDSVGATLQRGASPS